MVSLREPEESLPTKTKADHFPQILNVRRSNGNFGMRFTGSFSSCMIFVTDKSGIKAQIHSCPKSLQVKPASSLGKKSICFEYMKWGTICAQSWISSFYDSPGLSKETCAPSFLPGHSTSEFGKVSSHWAPAFPSLKGMIQWFLKPFLPATFNKSVHITMHIEHFISVKSFIALIDKQLTFWGAPSAPLSALIFTTTLWGQYYHYPHFADENMEVQDLWWTLGPPRPSFKNEELTSSCWNVVFWCQHCLAIASTKENCPGLPGGLAVKNSPAMQEMLRDAGLLPGSRRSPGGGNGNSL